MLVCPAVHSGLRWHGEHTRLVDGVQLTAMYRWPSLQAASHVEQLDCPVLLAYLPFSHVRHDVLLLAEEERVPIGHFWQLVDPETAEKLPGPHGMHEVAPVTLT